MLFINYFAWQLDIWCEFGIICIEDVPLVVLTVMYLVFTHKPVKVTVGVSGLCCCVCVMSFEC